METFGAMPCLSSSSETTGTALLRAALFNERKLFLGRYQLRPVVHVELTILQRKELHHKWIDFSLITLINEQLKTRSHFCLNV